MNEIKETEILESSPAPVIIFDWPKKKITRNIHGLIDGQNYVFNDDGSINWRKMIKPEFLVPNKQVFEKRQKPVPTSIEGLEDRELLILLGGIKELAQYRGFTSVNYKVETPSPDYVVAVCSISWIPNYETQNTPIVFSAIGDAHPNNTTSFGRQYLGPIAENRAFVRCVRNFLKINIVSQEELGPNSSQVEEDTATSLLKETMAKFNVTFEILKKKLVEEKFDGAASFNSVDDIPKHQQFALIERIKKKAAAKAS